MKVLKQIKKWGIMVSTVVSVVLLSNCATSSSDPVPMSSEFNSASLNNLVTGGNRSGGYAASRDSVDAFLNTPKSSSRVSRAREKSMDPSRKQIKTATLKIEAEDVAAAVLESKAIVKRRGGYVESSYEYSEDNASLAVRLPAAKLELAIDELAALGLVTYRRVKVKDVTNTYTDVEARLKNLRILRERLRGLYKKASSVKEMLKVEKELARVQTQLDSAEARIKTLRKNVQHSELSLSLSKKRVPGPLKLLGRSIGWIGKKLWELN